MERGQCTVVLTNVWMKQRKSAANDFPSPCSTLPTRPTVSGEYGRLDSQWRVRSHLETPGQPKAGTVTITRPQSLWASTHWECDEKKSRRWDSTGKAVGLRRRGKCVIINDRRWAKERKQFVSSTKLVLLGLKEASADQWMKWRVWQIPLTNFWGKCVPNWKLKSSFVWNKFNEKNMKTLPSSSFWWLWPVRKSSNIKQREQSSEISP